MVRVVRWGKKKDWASSASDGGLEGESWPQERISSTEKEDGSPFHACIHLSIALHPVLFPFFPVLFRTYSNITVSVLDHSLGHFPQKVVFVAALTYFYVKSVVYLNQVSQIVVLSRVRYNFSARVSTAYLVFLSTSGRPGSESKAHSITAGGLLKQE